MTKYLRHAALRDRLVVLLEKTDEFVIMEMFIDSGVVTQIDVFHKEALPIIWKNVTGIDY